MIWLAIGLLIGGGVGTIAGAWIMYRFLRDVDWEALKLALGTMLVIAVIVLITAVR